MARATARSAAGSSMRIPPAIVTKMSLVDKGSRAWRARTAMIIARRLRSKPFVTRRGMASSLRLTSAWTSTRKQRVPSTATWTAAPTDGAPSPRKSRDGSATPSRPGAGHLEDAELVGGAEAVLGGAQGAEEAVPVAFELEHRVDHVLEDAGAGDRALLGDVADEDDGRAGLLGEAQKDARRLAHLADAARRRGEGVAVEGLHRVDDDQRRAHGGDRLDHGLERASRRARRCRPAPCRCARRAS